ncbi:MAG: long-chain fatty acid--CoA ligase [Actinobacteria bacterium 13_2_20CM_2_71_6]|nr:MAG: long-chain fatty acid--CoA ligase [Actinobacteria bacterium 13_2_20CM_2_71_6]
MIAADARTIADLPFAAAAAYGDRPAQRARHEGKWVDRSFRELADRVRGLARGLVHGGIEPGDRVCVLAETRPEWSEAGLAILAAGAVLVPIYPSNAAEECEWVIGNSGARMVICENAAQLLKIHRVRDRLPDLAGTVVIDEGGLDRLAAAGAAAAAGPAGGAALDAELEHRHAALDPDDPSLIIYTSGTTGPPKGCVLTHRNWLTLCATNEAVSYILPGDVVYLFLPLAHVFAQITQFSCLDAGATLVYFGGDVRRIVPELAEVRPTFLPSVPRIFEKLYTAFGAGAAPLSDALFAKVRAVFGGRLRMALSGAAPISPAVLEFFQAAGVTVLEGYAMTESCGVGTVNTVENLRLGSVGYAAPGTRIRIAEDGEVLMSGGNIFAGYWRDPGATALTLRDGWLHTGDLGSLDADGFLTITGRKKDILITAGGKNVAPANLENDLRQSRWISHAVVYGDRQPYLVTLLSLDPDEILPWAAERGLPSSMDALAHHPAVLALLQGVVDDANAKYARVEQVKRFAVLDRELSQDAGELTPTLKVKRAVVATNHAALLSMLYDSGGAGGR